MKVAMHWEGLDLLLNDFTAMNNAVKGQVLRAGIRAGANVLVQAAKKDTPSKRVKRALISKVSSSGTAFSARVGGKRGMPGTRIFHLIEQGVRPHPIMPRRKKVLASNGKFFGKVIQHPGTQGRRQFLQLPRANVPEVERKTASAMAQAFKKITLRKLKAQMKG